ncbi:hypothetical protein KZP23_10585 [Echinicola marina]|uniref:hypothetical protein n=1 Tax=Echinicola marina TaxID=2859768 RepID=UPI001CF6859B|nr:hypothetical protein [Echinicola marina]UCS95419.1 hypothetical protein KZP23_10585 [Echinicola marina]
MKNQKQFFIKYWYLILIVCVGFGVFIWLNQPFSPDIWGTVSDWAMVVVTSLTAIFLILTFREQQRITSIENYKHVQNIKPYFELKPKLLGIKQEGENGEFSAVVTFDYYVRNSDAYDVEFNMSRKLYPKDVGIEWPTYSNSILHKDKNATFPFMHLFSVGESKIFDIKNNTLKTKHDYTLTADISFSDIEGNRYGQHISYVLLKDGKETIISTATIDRDKLPKVKLKESK